jgi:uncharacterized membrane protein YfhO
LFNQLDVTGYFEGVDENSIYLGIIPLTFLLLFFVRNKKGLKENIVLLITFLLILWLMMSNLITPSLNEVLQKLPVFSSFRIAQRYRFELIIPLALLCGMGMDHLLSFFRNPRLGLALVISCLLIGYIDLTVFSTRNFLSQTLIIANPEEKLNPEEAFLQTEANRLDFEIQRLVQIPENFQDEVNFIPWSYEYLEIRQNIGVINCYDSVTNRRYAFGIGNPAYRGEYYWKDPLQTSEIKNVFWSPNKLEFNIVTRQEETGNILVLNQNFYPGWVVTLDNGQCTRSSLSDNLVAAVIPASTQKVTLEFNPILYYTACR